MLGGRYVRDIHVVAGGPPYSGETIYRWDPQARRVRYDYYASDGGYSGGFADPGLVAAKDDLHVRAKACPALDRVSLDHAGVARECFRHGEEREKGQGGHLT